jgi:hypothetical protein
MKTIAYGDGSLKKSTQTLRVFMHALLGRHQATRYAGGS